MPTHKKKRQPTPNHSAALPTISIMIPCHNEELGIKACLQSCLRQTIPFNKIIVIDDASTDKTVKVIEKHFKAKLKKQIQLIRLTKNKGNKSYVQEYGISFIQTDLFVATDGDTILDPHFVENMLPHFRYNDVAAVAGHVQSIKDNWLTACREIEYTIVQLLHKKAQHFTNTIAVIPGCSAVFRTEIFKKVVTFDHDTLTEDLDFTYKLHAANHTIRYEQKSIVYTQDPGDLNSYMRQMKRWYAGNWQNFQKHSKTLLGKKRLGLEIILTYSETLFLAIVLFTIPLLNMQYTLMLYTALLVYSIGAAMICAIRTKRIDVLFFSPGLLVLLYVNSFIFMREGIKFFLFNRKEMVWYRAARKHIT